MSLPFTNLTAASYACMSPLDSENCIRHSIVTGFALVTLLAVVYKLFFFHYRSHSLWHQYLIFYTAGAECILLFVHWMLVDRIELAFIALTFKSAQVLTVAYFYCSLAAHQLRQDRVFSRVFVPLLFIIFLYFIATMVYALATTTRNELECTDSSWMQFSVGEFILCTTFLLAGIQITRKINAIRMSSRSRESQKFGLWLLIAAFFASSICSLTIDIYAIRSHKCQYAVGEEAGNGETAKYIIVRALRYLAPAWAMIVVFKVPDSSQQTNNADPESNDVAYTHVPDYVSEPTHVGNVASTPTGENTGLLGGREPINKFNSYTGLPGSYAPSPRTSISSNSYYR